MPSEGVPFSEGRGGHFGTCTGIENIYGTLNTAAYFDIDSDGDTAKIANAIDEGLNQQDIWIRQRFLAMRVTVPDSTSPYFEALAPIANERAGAWGYFKRGWTDAGTTNRKAMDGAMQGHWDHAEAELKLLIEAIRRGDKALPGEFSSVPAIFGDNRPVHSIIDPRDLSWDGW